MEASEPGYRIDALLCDSAQVVNGKLYVLGGAWSVTLPVPVPSSIVAVVTMPASEAGKAHTLDMALFESDGPEFAVPTADGPMPLRITASFEAAAHPANVPAGAPLVVPLALGLGPLPLEGGKRYEWRFALDGTLRAEWSLAFAVANPA